MPFIRSKVNVPVTKEQERKLKEGLGKAIKCVPGKSEQYLMLEFEDIPDWAEGGMNFDRNQYQ